MIFIKPLKLEVFIVRRECDFRVVLFTVTNDRFRSFSHAVGKLLLERFLAIGRGNGKVFAQYVEQLDAQSVCTNDRLIFGIIIIGSASKRSKDNFWHVFLKLGMDLYRNSTI